MKAPVPGRVAFVNLPFFPLRNCRTMQVAGGLPSSGSCVDHLYRIHSFGHPEVDGNDDDAEEVWDYVDLLGPAILLGLLI
jgi:hypothetical protein